MLRITAFERVQGSSRLYCVGEDGHTYLFPFQDGLIEAFMEAYALMPGEALELILLDFYDDTVDVPPYFQEDMRKVVEGILAKTDQLVWEIDRNETLAAITVSEDTAPEVSELWRENRRRNEAAAAAYERRQDELLAEDIVSSLPTALRSQPKDTESGKPLEGLGLAIQFVD